MNIFFIGKKVRHFLAEKRLKKRIISEQIHEERLNLQSVPHEMRTPISPQEFEQLRDLWGELDPDVSACEHEVFKHINGFDARYIGHHTYLPLVARRLNNYRYTKLLEHKALGGYLVNSPIRFPRSFVRCIDGEYYSEEMYQLSLDEAATRCASQDVLILKAASDTSGGKSVEKLVLTDKTPQEREDCVRQAFAQRKRDFVVQECLRQHPDTACFNPTSVNTFRITTLYLHGRFSVLSIVFRVGKAGMKVDNWGSGGIMIGVSLDGKMAPKGYDIGLTPFTEQNGTVFANTTFSQLPDILKRVEEAHTHAFSLCKLIGWDICIDENNEPVIIELNSSQPGLFGEQICTGPIFGARTQEVIEYCRKKTFRF